MERKVLLKGNFSVNTSIAPPSYSITELQGSIILAANANTNIFYLDNVNYVEIYGGSFDGNRANEPVTVGNKDVIPLSTANFCSIHDIYIQNSMDHGIRLLNSAYGNIIYAITAYNDYNDGITLTGTSVCRNIVSKCVLYYMGHVGVVLIGGAHENIIADNICYNEGNRAVYYGIYVSESTTTDNTITGMFAATIQILEYA